MLLKKGHNMKIIYKIIAGSKLYGLNDQNSDTDIRGIMLPTVEEALSLKQKDVFEESDNDTVYYSLQKFFRLALKSNPSVLEWLYAPETFESILIMTKEGSVLRENKRMFLSKEIYHRTKGYALSEFNKCSKLGDKGKKRKALIKEIGYDPKSMMNCIRILEQGIEILSTETLTLPRRNIKNLMKIKKGELPKQTCENIFLGLHNDLVKAFKKSKLPDKVDYEKANKLMIDLIINQ